MVCTVLPQCSLSVFGIIFFVSGGAALLHTTIGTWYVLCFLSVVFLYLVLSSSCLEERPCYILRLEHGMYCASSVESFCIWHNLYPVWRSGPVTDYDWNTVCTVLPLCSLSVFGITLSCLEERPCYRL